MLIPTLESVLNQSLVPHQIIVADDCSTDGTQQLLMKYEQKYGDVLLPLFSDLNRGIPGNRNFALKHVTGDYVSILDGDDIYVPEKTMLEMELLKSDPSIDCIYSNFHRVSPDGTFISKRFRSAQPSGNIFSSVAMGTFGIVRTMLARYSALKEVGFFDINVPKYDGYLLSLYLSKFCKFAYIDRTLVLKKTYPQSDSQQLSKIDHYNDFVYIFKKLKPMIKGLSQTEKMEVELFWHSIIDRFS